MCRCDGDVICVGHDLNLCSRWWYVCSVKLNSVGESATPYGTPVLNWHCEDCVIYICCVGFASLDVVCDELNYCAWNLGLYQLSDKLRGAIWLNPFSMVLFSVCSAVMVEGCVLYPCCVGVFGMSAVMQGRRLFSSILSITVRRDMGLDEVSLSISLLGFGMGTMLANFHMCDIMLVLRAVFNRIVRNGTPRGPMCLGT